MTRPIGAPYDPENLNEWKDGMVTLWYAVRDKTHWAALCCGLFFIAAVGLAVSFPLVYLLR